MTTCTGCPAQGVFAKLIIEDGLAPYTFDANSYWLDFLSESMQRKTSIIRAQGITGFNYQMADRSRDGERFVHGSLTINPSPAHFSALLPYLVGDLANGVYTPGNCPNPFGIMISRDLDVWQYEECRIASWILRGTAPTFGGSDQPQVMTLQMNIMGVDEKGPTSTPAPTWPNPEPTFPSGVGYTPYIIQDSDTGLYIYGAARQVYEFALMYDSSLKMNSVNSLTANSICPGMREVRVGIRLPWTAANQDLYDQPFTGDDARFTFTIENMSTVFDLFNLQVPAESPYVKDKNDVFFEINGFAGGDATNADIVVTNDAINGSGSGS